MEIINDKFYVGFEGEPEIRFILESKEITNTLIIWEGFFDSIMQTIKPEDEGWSGLAYYYHMDTGWYDEDHWEVNDLKKALMQFNSVDKSLLNEKSTQALDEICNLFTKAIANNEKIYMESD